MNFQLIRKDTFIIYKINIVPQTSHITKEGNHISNNDLKYKQNVSHTNFNIENKQEQYLFEIQTEKEMLQHFFSNEKK